MNQQPTTLFLEQLQTWGQAVFNWGLDYRSNMDNYPVKAQVSLGETLGQLPSSPPEQAEPIDQLLEDMDKLIVKGLTHWQHPRFFAYFQANVAPASLAGELMISQLAVNPMLWETAPSLVELEIQMIRWFSQALGLSGFQGLTHDTASMSTFTSVITIRETMLGHAGNQNGLFNQPVLTFYCSEEAHSSIDRAIWLAGIGQKNLRKIPIQGSHRGMDPNSLAAHIRDDIEKGFIPAGVIASIGATSFGASDPLEAIAKICKRHELFLVVDAAWAGSAMICPEYRHHWQGIEQADFIVINPHKWLGAQLDCSVQLIKKPELQRRALSINPDYLETRTGESMNLSQLSPTLGRRPRALKLWFLMRLHGMETLRNQIRNHIALATIAYDNLKKLPFVTITTARFLSLFSFQITAPNLLESQLNTLNRNVIHALNDSGKVYFSGTMLDNRFVIRWVVGTWTVCEADIHQAIDQIQSQAKISLEQINAI